MPMSSFYLGAQRSASGVASKRLVRDGARRRKPERASPHSISGDFAHLLDVFLVGVFQVQRAIAPSRKRASAHAAIARRNRCRDCDVPKL